LARRKNAGPRLNEESKFATIKLVETIPVTTLLVVVIARSAVLSFIDPHEEFEYL